MKSQSLRSSPGILHKYSAKLVAFQYGSQPTTYHTLIWIGGLSDGLMTVEYPSILAERLPKDWALVEISLTSSLNGWGCGSLRRDVAEISECVLYFRTQLERGGKIVLMGHSTGCQDAIEYLSSKGKESRPIIDGVILQAPVSDREAASLDKANYDTVVELCVSMIRDGKAQDVLPSGYSPFGKSVAQFASVPITAYRCLSLLSPNKDGDDDMFSSDLNDAQLQQSFGSIKSKMPLLILCSGADEYVPKSVDVLQLLKRWTAAVETSGGVIDTQNSGIIPGAHHNLADNDEAIVDDLCNRVHNFLKVLCA